MTKRFGGKDPVAIRIFQPYAYPDGSAEATEHLRYVGRTNELSAVFNSPTSVTLYVHDETTPGGFPVSGPRGTNGLNGLAGANGLNGANGIDGADGQSAYELAVANGFVGSLGAWFASLVGPTGLTGAAGADGTDGEAGATPVPIWTGTSLAWELPDGTPLTTPVDLRGPQGDSGQNGAQVWVSSHPTLTGVLALHIVPAGAPVGTVAAVTNLGMGEIRDFEYDPALGRLWITTNAGYEFEVNIPVVDTGAFLNITQHDASLVNVLDNSGAVLFRAHS